MTGYKFKIFEVVNLSQLQTTATVSLTFWQYRLSTLDNKRQAYDPFVFVPKMLPTPNGEASTNNLVGASRFQNAVVFLVLDFQVHLNVFQSILTFFRMISLSGSEIFSKLFIKFPNYVAKP